MAAKQISTVLVVCMAAAALAAEEDLSISDQLWLHVRVESGWGQTLLCDFRMEKTGAFTWYAKGASPTTSQGTGDRLMDRMIAGQAPAGAARELIHIISSAGDGHPALDAGQATFTWAEDRGTPRSRIYTNPKAEPCSQLIAALAAFAQKHGKRLDGQPKELAVMKIKLAGGSPVEKEKVLNWFMETPCREFVACVIDAILDDTVLPRQDDTGWGRVHHQAAMAMCRFAQTIDGKTLDERGRTRYSFHDDGGAATPERRRVVHRNWSEWWDQSKDTAEQRHRG